MTNLADRPATDLESVLAERAVGRAVVTGEHTTEDLRQWGSPASSEQAIAYTNLYSSFSAAPGRSGATVETAQVEFTSAGWTLQRGAQGSIAADVAQSS